MKALLGLIVSSVIISATIAWVFRYQQVGREGSGMYLLDRWTGNVYLAYPEHISATRASTVFFKLNRVMSIPSEADRIKREDVELLKHLRGNLQKKEARIKEMEESATGGAKD